MNTKIIRCIAVDDEPPALLLLKDYISRTKGLELAQTFSDALAASEFIRRQPVDLVLLDINMPDINGLELARSFTDKPMVIFTTAHAKYAVEGFELDAIDYLLKPISYERFSKAVAKAAEYFAFKNRGASEAADSLFVYSEYRMLRIPFAEIIYIESLEDYIRIHRSTGKPIMTLLTMKKAVERLPEAQFRRIHRSYIVARNQVMSVLNRKVKLSEGTELPVSDSYADFISEWKKV